MEHPTYLSLAVYLVILSGISLSLVAGYKFNLLMTSDWYGLVVAGLFALQIWWMLSVSDMNSMLGIMRLSVFFFVLGALLGWALRYSKRVDEGRTKQELTEVPISECRLTIFKKRSTRDVIRQALKASRPWSNRRWDVKGVRTWTS